MSGRSQLEVVQLTPPGRGAVATLLIEGPGAARLLESCFRPNRGRSLKSRPADGLVVGHFGSKCGEELVVRRRSDESVELHCHGGRAAVAMIEKALTQQGARVVAWQEWVVDHSEDPIAAAAHMTLAEARTERTAAILLDQYHGALRRALEEIEEALRNHDTASAGKQVEALLAQADVGRHLTRPWRVVLAGGANVGKSSLINALVGYRRAIVHRTPGTTRDIVTATTAVNGWPIELSDTAGLPPGTHATERADVQSAQEKLSDTAGLHGSDDEVQRAGIERARERLSDAELVVLVFDASVPWCPADQALLGSRPEALVVHNKCDLPPAGGERPSGLATSALTGQGIEALAAEIANRLVPDPPLPGAAVPFTAGQLEYLAGCRGRAGGGYGPADRSAADGS